MQQRFCQMQQQRANYKRAQTTVQSGHAYRIHCNLLVAIKSKRQKYDEFSVIIQTCLALRAKSWLFAQLGISFINTLQPALKAPVSACLDRKKAEVPDKSI